MEYVRVTKDNLEKEHICCAISNNKNGQFGGCYRRNEYGNKGIKVSSLWCLSENPGGAAACKMPILRL